MAAKDTVMSDAGLFKMVETQAEIIAPTFFEEGRKAGVREVVEDINKEMSNAPMGLRLARFEKLLNKWKAKLKEWGIE